MPTISAVLIVKDEEAALEECLRSVRWVDEIVVYDTGSTDRTVEIARAHADVVVQGYWNDDFGGARNRAIEHATSEWILVVDADERFVGDPDAVRRRLGRDGVTLHTMVVESARPVEVGLRGELISVRFFLRDSFHYTGALHEQVTARPGATRKPVIGAMSHARLLHHGYGLAVVADRGKAQRNLELAERELAEALERRDPWLALARANVARSLAMAGRNAEALAAGEQALTEGRLPDPSLVTLAKAMTWVAFLAGEPEAGRVWLHRWVERSDSPAWAWARAAQLAASVGDARGALDALEHVPTTTVNAWQQRLDRAELAEIEVWALTRLDRTRDARQVAVRAAKAGYLPSRPVALVGLHEHLGLPLDEVLEALTPSVWQTLALLATTEADPAAGRLLEAMVAVRPGDPSALTAGAGRARVLTIEEAMQWSLRVHEAGLPDLCPLRAIARQHDLDPRQRALAAAIAFEAFADDSVLVDLEQALAAVPPEHEAEMAALLEAAAPGLVVAAQ